MKSIISAIFLLVLSNISFGGIIQPGHFSVGDVGIAIGGNAQLATSHSQVVYWADYLENREWPNGFTDHPTGRGTPYPEVTVTLDLYKIGEETKNQYGLYVTNYQASLSLYEDPQNNATYSDYSTFFDGNKLVTFTGSGSATTWAPIALGGQGSIIINWPDQYPFVDIGTEYEIWPHNVDAAIVWTYRIPGDIAGPYNGNGPDGWINTIDYAQIDAAYLSHQFDNGGATWDNGDFNGDGIVDYKDYALMDYSLYQQNIDLGLVRVSSDASRFGLAFTEYYNAIPEPSTLLLLGLGSTLLIKRRK